MKSLFTSLSFLIVLLLNAPLTFAGEYLGFALGQDTFDAVIKKLQHRKADFDTKLTFRGDDRLRAIKVTTDTRFQELGDLKAAWLEFRPDGVLYALTVTWQDAGPLHTTLQDALDLKYPLTRKSDRGFNTARHYRDQTTHIQLRRNTFGFDTNQTTTLEYVDAPSLPAVEAMKQQIDADIKQRNRDKAGADL